METLHPFHGPNEGYVLELYDRYRQNPESVDAATRAFFEQWSPPAESAEPKAIAGVATDKIVGAVNYVQAIRSYGHAAAQLDPLGTEPVGDPALSPEAHGITEDDLRQLPASLVGGPIAESAPNALEATQALKA